MACLLPLLLGGCIVFPTGSRIISDGNFSHEALAFLDLPDASRDETIATLGKPAYESKNLGVLLYLYHSVDTYHVMPIPIEVKHTDVNPIAESDGETDPELWGLFVAYDEKGRVFAHALRRVGDGGLEEECANWGGQPSQAR